jgi:hypothetical protein
MGLRIARVRVLRRQVVVMVRLDPGSGRVFATAYRKGRGRVSRRVRSVPAGRGTARFVATLSPGRWRVVVTARPAVGFAVPRAAQRDFTILRKPVSRVARNVDSAAGFVFELRASPLAIDQNLSTALYFNQRCFWLGNSGSANYGTGCVQ